MVLLKPQVIDARGHLIGRLASTIAKELLNGQKIVLVRAEELHISGSLFRNLLKYHHFLKKKSSSNPDDGPFHYRSPARIFWRVLRGMLPHKRERGQRCLEHLKIFEGIPPVYQRVKRVVVPQALRVLRLRPGRKYTRLGDLSSHVGWTQDKLVQTLEEKRKVKSAAFYKAKKTINKLKADATKNAAKALAPIQGKLAEFGF